jgi:hypothetical protein
MVDSSGPWAPCARLPRASAVQRASRSRRATIENISRRGGAEHPAVVGRPGSRESRRWMLRVGRWCVANRSGLGQDRAHPARAREVRAHEHSGPQGDADLGVYAHDVFRDARERPVLDVDSTLRHRAENPRFGAVANGRIRVARHASRHRSRWLDHGVHGCPSARREDFGKPRGDGTTHPLLFAAAMTLAPQVHVPFAR